MKIINASKESTRRQFLSGILASAGSLALAGDDLFAQKKYAPRLVCNMYFWVQLFSTPYRYVSSSPDPLKSALKASAPAKPAPIGGSVWTDEQWNTAFSDVQYAGYRRMEMLSGTMSATPIEKIKGYLDKYGLVINHIWHGGTLYPAQVAEKTIAGTIEVLDRFKDFKSPEFFFDPFGDRGPLSDDDARTQNRGLDRIGREVKDRGMKLCVHNHEGPMRYGAKEWLGVVHNTDPALVLMCLDMDWTWQAGTDPLPLLYEAGDRDRLGALHMRTQHKKITDQTMGRGH